MPQSTEIPVTPTHALLREEVLREAPAAGAPGTRTLKRGEQVRVVEMVGDGTWAKVALKGQPVGYLPLDALLGLVQ
jgi:hypothetical protein